MFSECVRALVYHEEVVQVHQNSDAFFSELLCNPIGKSCERSWGACDTERQAGHLIGYVVENEPEKAAMRF